MDLGVLHSAGLPITPCLILAPMSGITNSAFRSLIKEENPEAVGLVVTEFISIEGLIRRNKQSLEMMRHRQEEKPLAVQIFGYDSHHMADAAAMVEEAGADFVDVNCGCPVPKVVKRGGGCQLMREPRQLAKILRAIRARIKAPLSIKMRAGWDEGDKNALEIGHIAEEEGAAMVSIHPRTRKAGYQGPLDWELVASLCSKLSIPVIASGGVDSFAAAQHVLALGAKGVMIGRPALSHPWIFSEIKAHAEGKAFSRPEGRELVRLMHKYVQRMLDCYPEKYVLGRSKQFASQLIRNVPNSARLRRALCRSVSLAQFLDILGEVESGRTPAGLEGRSCDA